MKHQEILEIEHEVAFSIYSVSMKNAKLTFELFHFGHVHAFYTLKHILA